MPDRKMFRGDTFIFPFQVMVTPAGSPPGTPPSPQSIVGWKFWFTMKYNVQDPDNLAITQQTSDGANPGIVPTQPLQGKGNVTVPPLVTIGFPDSDTIVQYDVQGKDLFGNIYTVERGTITVSPDITRAII